jgi:flagellar FliL protein
MADDKPAPKKKGGKLKLILIGIGAVALLGGGGVAAGVYVGRSHGKGPVEDPNLPKLVERKEAGEANSPWRGNGPDPRKYQASYYTFEQNFTSNLKNSDSFVQVGLGASTFYDHKVLDRLKDDEMPIRSAVLMTLAETDPDTINTAAGKKALQGQLRDAINGVLLAREGFGGVDDVYFTNFVIQ